MSLDAQPPPTKPFERVMVFIDGGYLRELCKKRHGHDNIDFVQLRQGIISSFNKIPTYPFQANLVRIYYYDACVDRKHPDYDAQREYFKSIDNKESYTVRLGELVQSSKKKFKQKGVDILMAIDALAKAYLNQYDLGIFMVGDRDFIPLVEAVKDTGKKTLCFSHLQSSSYKLLRTFDVRIYFKVKELKKWLKKQSS